MSRQVSILDKSDGAELLKRLEAVHWGKLKRGACGRERPTMAENQAACRVHRCQHEVITAWLEEMGLL